MSKLSDNDWNAESGSSPPSVSDAREAGSRENDTSSEEQDGWLSALMGDSGISGLAEQHDKKNPPSTDVLEKCLRKLASMATSLDPLQLATAHREAIRLLKTAGIAHPEKDVKAAFEVAASALEKRVPDEEQTIDELLEAASPFNDSEDPLEYLEHVIRERGYGGDVSPALLVAICVTSRALQYKPGQAPAHLMLKGEASSGKSFALDAALMDMPEEAIHKIDAGTPRALIYDESSIRHKALVFSERDSLPKGDKDGDDTAASAIRSLLQEGRFDYHVVVKSDSGRPHTVRIEKEGPAVLITTGTRFIAGQLGTRLFTFNVKEDMKQISAALEASATRELSDDNASSEPNAGIVAFQLFLQRKAPWNVQVPFARALASCLEKHFQSSRVLRDFGRLCSMVKAVALLRQRKRERSETGVILAALEDYETVRRLASRMYESTSSGVSPNLRKVVQLVAQRIDSERRAHHLPDEDVAVDVSLSSLEIGRELGMTRDLAKKTVRAAFKRGFLVDRRPYPNGSRQKYRLSLGEELPESNSLPTVDEIAAAVEQESAADGTEVRGRSSTTPGPRGVQENLTEEEGDRRVWALGTTSGDVEGGGRPPLTTSDRDCPPPPSSANPGSQEPNPDQDTEREGDTLGPRLGRFETSESQEEVGRLSGQSDDVENGLRDPDAASGTGPLVQSSWWPAPLPNQKVLRIEEMDDLSILAQVERELSARVEHNPKHVTAAQTEAQLHCLAAWSLARAGVIVTSECSMGTHLGASDE